MESQRHKWSRAWRFSLVRLDGLVESCVTVDRRSASMDLWSHAWPLFAGPHRWSVVCQKFLKTLHCPWKIVLMAINSTEHRREKKSYPSVHETKKFQDGLESSLRRPWFANSHPKKKIKSIVKLEKFGRYSARRKILTYAINIVMFSFLLCNFINICMLSARDRLTRIICQSCSFGITLW